MNNKMAVKPGSIVCVGIGMVLGSHLSALTKQFIVEADILFMGVSNPITEQWLSKLNDNAVSLQPFYQEGKDRRIVYRQMVEVMMSEVRQGKKVVAAFYGHPGVFAWAPHQVIATAKAEGYHAHMEPGISAEDCLYADMAIDPGNQGIVHHAATQFLLHRRTIDSTAYLILWQVGFMSDLSHSSFQNDPRYIQLLTEILLNDYPQDHQVAIYVAATLPIEKPSVQWCKLQDLPQVSMSHEATLVIPPATKAKIDEKARTRLNGLANELKH